MQSSIIHILSWKPQCIEDSNHKPKEGSLSHCACEDRKPKDKVVMNFKQIQ